MTSSITRPPGSRGERVKMKASIVLNNGHEECMLSVRSERGKEHRYPLRKLTDAEEDGLLWESTIPRDVADMAAKIITEKYTSTGLPLLAMYTERPAKISCLTSAG